MLTSCVPSLLPLFHRRNLEGHIQRAPSDGARQQKDDGQDAENGCQGTAERAGQEQYPDHDRRDGPDYAVSCPHIFFHGDHLLFIEIIRYERKAKPYETTDPGVPGYTDSHGKALAFLNQNRGPNLALAGLSLQRKTKPYETTDPGVPGYTDDHGKALAVLNHPGPDPALAGPWQNSGLG